MGGFACHRVGGRHTVDNARVVPTGLRAHGVAVNICRRAPLHWHWDCCVRRARLLLLQTCRRQHRAMLLHISLSGQRLEVFAGRKYCYFSPTNTSLQRRRSERRSCRLGAAPAVATQIAAIPCLADLTNPREGIGTRIRSSGVSSFLAQNALHERNQQVLWKIPKPELFELCAHLS